MQPPGLGFFSFLYLKKIKISKIYGGFEKFQNYTPVARPLPGRQGPVALWLGVAWATGACRPLAGRQDLNVKKKYI